MARVGGPLSVARLCTSMLCAKIWYHAWYQYSTVSGWSMVIAYKFFSSFRIGTSHDPCLFSTTSVVIGDLTLSVTPVSPWVAAQAPTSEATKVGNVSPGRGLAVPALLPEVVGFW